LKIFTLGQSEEGTTAQQIQALHAKYMPENAVLNNTRHKTNPKKRGSEGKKWAKMTQYCGQWWALALAM
jgi:hypothetical protein